MSADLPAAAVTADAITAAGAQPKGVVEVEQHGKSWRVAVRYSETDADFLWLSRDQMRDVVAAAALPELTADEREACAQLADYYAEEIACRECGSEAAYSAARLIRLRGGLLAGTADGAHTPGGAT